MTVNLTIFFAMTAVVAFLIGLSKGGLGGSLGALATPMMALVMPADQVIGLVLPVLMFADIFAVALHWRRWDRRLVLLLIPGSVLGVTIGTLFITNAPTGTLRTALGIIVLIFTVYKVFEKRILGSLKYEGKDWHGLLAGTVTGFSSALAHTGGPPVSIYLLMQDVTPRVFVATSAIFFFLLNWIKVPYYFYARLFDFNRLWQIAWLMPLVPAGVWIGKWMSERVDKETFERIIIVLLAIGGLLLIAG
ncbi:MAG TPA: sulfite exporter TauE/SafE family protein [Chloroflexi bacterium]|nr:sulfite exporter TauE/SafE family protein [Chloroflexota bacterium]